MFGRDMVVIAMLRARGVRDIVASDFSAGRRGPVGRTSLSIQIPDPPSRPPPGHGHIETVPQAAELAVGAMEEDQAAAGSLAPRLADSSTARHHPEAPGDLRVCRCPGGCPTASSPARRPSRVVVVGVCMEPNRLRPAMAINKEIELRFVIGYTPLEFATP